MAQTQASPILLPWRRRVAWLAALVGVAAVPLVGATGAASARGSAMWGPYEGSCVTSGAREQVLITRAPGAGTFAPYAVSGNRTLVPYQLRYDLLEGGVTVLLKARHTFPVGVPVTKPGPAPRNPVTCEFSGLLPNTGDAVVPFTATVTGTMRG